MGVVGLKELNSVKKEFIRVTSQAHDDCIESTGGSNPVCCDEVDKLAKMNLGHHLTAWNGWHQAGITRKANEKLNHLTPSFKGFSKLSCVKNAVEHARIMWWLHFKNIMKNISPKFKKEHTDVLKVINNLVNKETLKK